MAVAQQKREAMLTQLIHPSFSLALDGFQFGDGEIRPRVGGQLKLGGGGGRNDTILICISFRSTAAAAAGLVFLFVET